MRRTMGTLEGPACCDGNLVMRPWKDRSGLRKIQRSLKCKECFDKRPKCSSRAFLGRFEVFKRLRDNFIVHLLILFYLFTICLSYQCPTSWTTGQQDQEQEVIYLSNLLDYSFKSETSSSNVCSFSNPPTPFPMRCATHRLGNPAGTDRQEVLTASDITHSLWYIRLLDLHAVQISIQTNYKNGTDPFRMTI